MDKRHLQEIPMKLDGAFLKDIEDMNETERNTGDKLNADTKGQYLMYKIETMPFCLNLYDRNLITKKEMESVDDTFKLFGKISANVNLLRILNTKDIKKSVMANILEEVNQNYLLKMFYPKDDTDVVEDEKGDLKVIEPNRSSAEEINLKKRFPDLVQDMHIPDICYHLYREDLINASEMQNIFYIQESYGYAQANRKLLQILSTKCIEKSIMLEVLNSADQLHLVDMFYPPEDSDEVKKEKIGSTDTLANRGSAKKTNPVVIKEKKYPVIIKDMIALPICDQLYSLDLEDKMMNNKIDSGPLTESLTSEEEPKPKTAQDTHIDARLKIKKEVKTANFYHIKLKHCSIPPGTSTSEEEPNPQTAQDTRIRETVERKKVTNELDIEEAKMSSLEKIYQDSSPKTNELYIEGATISSRKKIHQDSSPKTNELDIEGVAIFNLEKILQDSSRKVCTINIHFDAPPKREDETESTCHTLTSDIVEILVSYAFSIIFENPKMVHFFNLSLGKKRMMCTFSTKAISDVKYRLGETYTSRLACVYLMKPYLVSYNIDKDDFEFEKNEFARLIILDYICYALVKSRSDIVEAYASSKKHSILLVAFMKDVESSSDFFFYGFRVCCKFYHARSSESISAENYAQKEDLNYTLEDNFEFLNEIITSNTKRLFRNHSNLEGIGTSMVRSTTNGYDTTDPCVVLYCRCKSYIPYGEERFQEYLIHSTGIVFKTDVREGYFNFGTNGNSLVGAATDWHKELAMGCSIGPKSGQYHATIGPFVKVEGIAETCFLTVRHMFQPFDLDDRRLQGTKLMQPADGDTKPNPYSQAVHGGQSYDRECGEVLTSTFNENVDAAVVKIKADRSPSRGYFVVPTENELNAAGFSQTNFPAFDDGSVMNARTFTTEDFATERVIKFGKVTGLTKGSLELNSMAVKVVDEEALAIQYNGRLVSKVMKNQLKVNSHSMKTFFQLGDSGSAVFLVDKNNKLHCIGMAIGSMSDLSCIVTPIQVVLSELEKKLSKNILLKDFPMEKMV